MKITQEVRDTIDALRLVPRKDEIDHLAQSIASAGRCDEQLAPIWAEKLRHTYTKVFEIKYPEYMAANGDLLPVDSSVNPADETWEYYTIDQHGFADWIDDDGRVAPSGSMTMTRETGRMAEMGHKYELTIFDLERAARANLPIQSLKQKNAKRVHDARTNWVWLFGDSGKQLPGLCNHPNITTTIAPLNGGASSRLWENKDVDEIAADVSLLIDTIATNTLGAYHATKVYMPRTLFHILRNRRLGAGDGFSSLLDYLRDRYKGDDSGQGKVTFHIMNECQASLRQHPVTQNDDSGITGDFLLAIPTADKEELSFIRARPLTQRPPQEIDLVLSHMTHSKVGGCKCQIPLAVHRLDFLTT